MLDLPAWRAVGGRGKSASRGRPITGNGVPEIVPRGARGKITHPCDNLGS